MKMRFVTADGLEQMVEIPWDRANGMPPCEYHRPIGAPPVRYDPHMDYKTTDITRVRIYELQRDSGEYFYRERLNEEADDL
jgi:hypothetical protein